MLQLVSPSNQACMMTGMQYTFDGTSSTATPGHHFAHDPVECRDHDAATPVKCPRTDERKRFNRPPSTTRRPSPTASNTLRFWHCHPQLGFIYEPPYGGYFKCVGGGRIGAKLNFPATVNVAPSFWYEE